MSKRSCCIGEGLKKGTWTPEEDKKLRSYIRDHGEGGWRDIPKKAGLKRCGKSCRLRWTNYLKPGIKRGEFSYEEEQIIIMLHASRGNKWSSIAQHLPERTDNEIKNYWNTHLKKRLIDKGIDPVTHKELASSPSPAEPKKFDSQDESNPDEHSSQWSSTSPVSIPLSSSFDTTIPEISSGETLMETDFLRHREHFKWSSSTSRLLNKFAARGSSIGRILSTSMEGTLISSASSSCLPNLFSQSSEQLNDAKEDNGSITGYDISQFVEQFINDEDIAENNGYFNQDLLMSDVPSTLVDEDNMNEDITGWSSLLDLPAFSYETEQDSDDMIRNILTEPDLTG